jgi:hypothetical protein
MGRFIIYRQPFLEAGPSCTQMLGSRPISRRAFSIATDWDGPAML